MLPEIHYLLTELMFWNLLINMAYCLTEGTRNEPVAKFSTLLNPWVQVSARHAFEDTGSSECVQKFILLRVITVMFS